MHLGIDLELIVEDLVTDLVDSIGLLSLVLPTSVHWAPFTIPDAKTALVHPLTLLLITPPQTTLLFLSTGVNLGGTGEAEGGVIMD